MTFTTNFNIDLGGGMKAVEAEMFNGSFLALITVIHNKTEYKTRLDLGKQMFIDMLPEVPDKIAISSIVESIIGRRHDEL